MACLPISFGIGFLQHFKRVEIDYQPERPWLPPDTCEGSAVCLQQRRRVLIFVDRLGQGEAIDEHVIVGHVRVVRSLSQ